MLSWGILIVKRPIQLLAIITVACFLANCKVIPNRESNSMNIIVRIPSSAEEIDFIWSLLKNIQFYNSNKYKLSLPDNETAMSIVEKANRQELSNEDYTLLKSDFTTNIYNQNDYQKSYRIINNTLPIAKSQQKIFIHYKTKWNFYIPKQYEVLLTLYGPGGSYNPQKGIITIMTTKQGTFKRGQNPLETILHEAVHIGIEDAIVRRYNLSHWEKERIVDQFMMYHFKEICPDYKMQPTSETAIDEIFKNENAWDNLPEAVSQFISGKKQK